MIDISSDSIDPRSHHLSNFTYRPFTLDGIECVSIESALQSLKKEKIDAQRAICRMQGKEANRYGQTLEGWKETQELWWKGSSFKRLSREYQNLISHIFTSAYTQSRTFKKDLLLIGDADVCHSIGKLDPKETVLTEMEFLYQINRLRVRALTEDAWEFPRFQVYREGRVAFETTADAAGASATDSTTVRVGDLALDADMTLRFITDAERHHLTTHIKRKIAG